MKRRMFLKIAALSTVTALAWGSRSQDSLDQWAQRFDARIGRSKSGLEIQVAMDPDNLRDALSALDHLADGTILCEGKEARGEIGGEAFVVKFG